MPSFFLTTLGCKVNQFETEAIGIALEKAGWKKTPIGADADICIINTCTVTGKASMQSRQAIRNLVRKCPRARIIVTGCYAQTEADEIRKIDGVHMIVSHREKHLIPSLILSGLESEGFRMSEDCNTSCSETEFKGIDVQVYGRRTRPFLKIQDGCNAFCTYCIVPHTRGRSRSMTADEVLERLHSLGEAGFREVVLTGIHIGSWSSDSGTCRTFIDLLRRIENEHPVSRIRISSIEPREITDDMISLISRSDMFCRHFHIPLQSGDNRILERMHRPYTREFFRDRVNAILSPMPDAAIGADIMVGFPGESEEAYKNTYDLINALPVMYLHVFPFSPRRKTPAATFPDPVDPRNVKERTDTLRVLGDMKKKEFIERLTGKTVNVLIENRRDRTTGQLKGLTSNYVTVLAPGPDTAFNTLQPIRIDAVEGLIAKGRIIDTD